MRMILAAALAFALALVAPAPVGGQGVAYDEAYQAALRILGGVPPSECNARAPEGTACVERYPDLAAGRTAELGIARFSITFVSTPGSYVAFFGRTSAGGWDYWFGAQDQGSQLVELPGDLLACTGVGGAPAQIQLPGAAAAVTVPPLTSLRAEAFLLTSPGAPAPLGDPERAGSGWYRISSPVAGWVPERDVTDAVNGDCTVHDLRYR